MDANHSSYVHELSMEDVRQIFERARSFKPQREFNILFAGGEPTIAQNFLDAVGHAWRTKFKRICVVTNGIRLGQEDDFAARMRAAGVHQVYLQLDGILFQPIMFAGRDALVTDADRAARRYTLADLAHDLHRQTAAFEWQPLRDWFPISVYSAFGNLFDNM